MAQLDKIDEPVDNDLSVSNISEVNASVVQIDVGNLTAFDPRPIEAKDLKKDSDKYLLELTRTNTQLLINQLFNLPVERVEDVIVAKLPKGTTVYPREKPLPKAKPLTKWEQYAKLKGIHKKKKSRKVYDEVKKEWRPTWGYKRANDTTKDWLIEIGKNEDPNQDFFAKRTTEKNERVAKNELQRLRNVARSTGKKKVPGIGLTPTTTSTTDNPEKLHVKKALQMAKTADASMSKFSEKLKDEKKVTRGFGKKRKFESNFTTIKSEKEKQLKLFDKLSTTKGKSSKGKLNVDKAANKYIASEDNESPSAKKRKTAGGKRRSADGKHRRVGVKAKGKKSFNGGKKVLVEEKRDENNF